MLSGLVRSNEPPTHHHHHHTATMATSSSETDGDRRDPSYVGISCTNYGYADYSRQSRNFSPVSRVPLDPPPEGAPFATALTNDAFHSLSAVCSPINEIHIENAFEVAATQQNGGNSDGSSIIAQRIQSLYGEKTKEEFKKRSKSAGPFQRSPYEAPSYRAGLLELGTKFNLEKEELRPSNFPKSVKEKTAFVEKLIKKDVKEGVKPLEELKKPPRFEIPSRQKSEEYYRQQREIEKQKALLFSQRLKEAEERRKAQQAVEAEQRRVAEEQLQKQLEEEEKSGRVEAIPQYSKVESEQVVELVNTSLGSSDSLVGHDADAQGHALAGSGTAQGHHTVVVETVGVDEVDATAPHRGQTRTEEHSETRIGDDGSLITHTIITKTTTVVSSSGQPAVEGVFAGDIADERQQQQDSGHQGGETQHQQHQATRSTNRTADTNNDNDNDDDNDNNKNNNSQESQKRPPTRRGFNKASTPPGRSSSNAEASSSIMVSKDTMAGTEFLAKLDDAEDRIRQRVCATEEYLKETHSEEVRGRLRAAIGKGNLLIAKKCAQFRGLCEKNLREPVEGEFPTTRADIEGFWDMIHIQIDQVLEAFAEIETMRANGWKDIPSESAPAKTSTSNSPAKKKLPNPLKPRNGSANAEKQREEARKRLMEAKRAAKDRPESAPGGDSNLVS